MSTLLTIRNFGQIKKAKIRFGDLTVFVGPQASGKSIVLQLLKLLLDGSYVQARLRRSGVDWGGRVPDLLDAYFGEGMRALWQVGKSKITWEGRAIDMRALAARRDSDGTESLFYVPAQRALTLRNGWPIPFGDYPAGDPFVVRQFSRKLGQILERFTSAEDIFPQKHTLRRIYRHLLREAIFKDFTLRVDKRVSQKRLVLGERESESGLPFMVWSTGQREFVPLLLAFYSLMPPNDDRVDIDWVVIEEPEMGLHTQAISAVLLTILGLLQRGYRVCISTHSPHVLDVVWGLNELKRHQAPISLVREMFGVPKERVIDEVAASALKKDARVYYFDRASGEVKDISTLDPGATDENVAGWGGLTEFSGRVADVVARAVARGE